LSSAIAPRMSRRVPSLGGRDILSAASIVVERRSSYAGRERRRRQPSCAPRSACARRFRFNRRAWPGDHARQRRDRLRATKPRSYRGLKGSLAGTWSPARRWRPFRLGQTCCCSPSALAASIALSAARCCCAIMSPLRPPLPCRKPRPSLRCPLFSAGLSIRKRELTAQPKQSRFLHPAIATQWQECANSGRS
jgi:hypothetical protein